MAWRDDQSGEVELTQEIDWQKWRRQGTEILGESIEFAARIVGTTEERIERSRMYGVAPLAQSIECARAIRRCIAKELPSPAFALARAQYEGALRGHIIVHEIELEDLSAVLGHIGLWVQDKQSLVGLPKIVIRRTEWKVVGLETKHDWRPFQHDIANYFAGWVGSNSRHMQLLHDLAHSGMTHALQMLDEHGNIEPRYSDQNQTQLLELADRAVMFSVMTWPGAQQKFRREIELRMARTTQLRSAWAGTTST
ncbi:MAG: hypothetical protein OXI64_11765 [Defluviicoccus sp.]|nr:hypothetical protein [Defluviicoccus sp.]